LGVPNFDIWKTGMFESIFMIAISVAISTIVLLVVIGIQQKTGIDIMFVTGGKGVTRAGIRLEGLVYPIMGLRLFSIVGVFAFFVVGVSYLWSIKRVLKKLSFE